MFVLFQVIVIAEELLMNPQQLVENPECPISLFHLASLDVTDVPKTSLCPHCRKLLKLFEVRKKPKSQMDEFF